MSFFSGIFGGSNPTLNTNIPSLQQTGKDANTTGFGDVSDASKFFRGILNGDTSVVAPQVSAIQKQGQNKIQTLSQFSNRAGGTNAEAATAGDTTRAAINDLLAKLKGGAATSLASLGSGLINTGIGATNASTETSQMRMNNWKDSILGSGINKAAGFFEGFGLPKG